MFRSFMSRPVVEIMCKIHCISLFNSAPCGNEILPESQKWEDSSSEESSEEDDKCKVDNIRGVTVDMLFASHTTNTNEEMNV